jgi:hypothetical protein
MDASQRVRFPLEETGIAIDWNLGEAVWRSAGRAFQCYAERRRKQRDSCSRRIPADFLIRAHAQTRSYRLLTLNERLYKAAFPTLTIETIWKLPRWVRCLQGTDVYRERLFLIPGSGERC